MALEALQQQGRGMAVGVLALVAIWMYPSGLSFFEPMGVEPNDPRIRQSAWIVVFVWPVAAASLLLHRRNPTKYEESRRMVRVVYAAGLASMLVHLAVAFHLGHGWSHSHAFDHTERVGGFGPGVFISYFYTLLWIIEATWMWVAFDGYLNRTAWLNRLIIGFMWFVLFNASVVYGNGIVRGLGALFLTAPWLAVLVLIKAHPSSTESRSPADRVPPPDAGPGRTP